MRGILFTLLVIGLALVVLFGVPLLIGIWLPDVIFAPERTLAEQRTASGYSFRVVQYWNRADFYNTEMFVTSPDGVVKFHLLDADDSKSWRMPMSVDEQHRTTTVMLSGGRVKTVNW